ncbi:Homocysteine-responsive endoplasmic reticulum-resident ubiquitin-like domain member 2 [Brachionus plicatilis]|uniref:Homocysteine-responsive endoplasmic reticulum-resident ubiquitin-like domain member 2 n=1 Tax=Brachionus plicatilis TaxID=10195 RepID=A0A3M7QJN2_BRAPC|nr:Homocysteine-responsive endoplasmic reticulum-resident ubiquitin-like domain member 2 [Brachionus plicatilis]
MANVSTVCLTIKAANQNFEDFVINSCSLDWTIKDLKEHLSSNYPRKPNSTEIRLIYSGKLLHDHFSLKECIRHTSGVESHILHLVHSSGNHKPTIEKIEESETDLDNELTPNSSLNSESESTTSTSSINSTETTPLESNSQSVPDQSNQDQAYPTLSPKQQYELTLNSMLNYFQSIGVPVQNNPWYSSYVQQMALYNYMYMNYINSSNPNLSQVRHESTRRAVDEVSGRREPEVRQEQQDQARQRERAPRVERNQANNDADREDDWLGTLHNVVSFLILLSIVYYYSSLERFFFIFVIAIILICYHKGWLQLQRRRVIQNPENVNQERREREENEQNGREERNTTEQTHVQMQPTTVRLIFTFILKFFTSLIPERPRAIN